MVAKEEHILNDYRQMGVQPYAEIQKEEEGQREEEIEDSKIVKELSWNEMRKLAKELSGEVIRSKEQAQEILNRHGY